tara:strand:+ start:54 stop:200 length:147 start_codon:yes stop_codon:yes gene_type:complete
MIGLHKCPTCTKVVGESHKCKPQIKVTHMALDTAKEWLEKILISRAIK